MTTTPINDKSPKTPPPSTSRVRGYPFRQRASSVSSLRSSLSDVLSDTSVESSELDWNKNEDDNLHKLCDDYANESSHTPYAAGAPPNQLVHHLAKTARKNTYGANSDRWRHSLRSTRRRINMIMREDGPSPYFNRSSLPPSPRLTFRKNDNNTPHKVLANITADAFYSPDKDVRQALGSISIDAPSQKFSSFPVRRSARHATLKIREFGNKEIIHEETFIDLNSTPVINQHGKIVNNNNSHDKTSPTKRLAPPSAIEDLTSHNLNLRPRKRQNSIFN